MTQDDNTRNIKPRSEVPAGPEEIIDGAPDRELSTDTASNLAGMRSAHFKKIIREGFDETIGNTTTLETLAKVYTRARPAPSLITDRHFTTDEGREGLVELVEYLEDPANPPNQNRWTRNEFEVDQIHLGSVFDHLSQFPLKSIQSVVTSPPYWGMRVYSEEFDVEWSDGLKVSFGGEQTPEDYIRHTLEFFLRLKPVLEDSATVWWNVGDVYNTRTEIRETSMDRKTAVVNNEERSWADLDAKRDSYGHEYLKDKDLTLIPYRIAQGLQRCGYYVRSVITWRKEKVVPETVADRPTTGHEILLLISKSKTYKFNEKRWRREERESFGGSSQYENEDLRTVWELDRIKSEIRDKQDAIADELEAMIEDLNKEESDDSGLGNDDYTRSELKNRLTQLMILLADERDNLYEGLLQPNDHQTTLKEDAPGTPSGQDSSEIYPFERDPRRSPPVWSMPVADGKYQHAAPFPVQLPARCILLSVGSGNNSGSDVVYDPFMGSGTTAVAAENINGLAEDIDLSWVGSEIVPNYKQLAEDRIKNITGDPDEWVNFDQTTVTDFT